MICKPVKSGLKDGHDKKMILEYIQKYGKVSRKEIDSLLNGILPSIMDDKQKKNKINSIIYSMSRKERVIENKGTSRLPKWVKTTKQQIN